MHGTVYLCMSTMNAFMNSYMRVCIFGLRQNITLIQLILFACTYMDVHGHGGYACAGALCHTFYVNIGVHVLLRVRVGCQCGGLMYKGGWGLTPTM